MEIDHLEKLFIDNGILSKNFKRYIELENEDKEWTKEDILFYDIYNQYYFDYKYIISTVMKKYFKDTNIIVNFTPEYDEFDLMCFFNYLEQVSEIFFYLDNMGYLDKDYYNNCTIDNITPYINKHMEKILKTIQHCLDNNNEIIKNSCLDCLYNALYTDAFIASISHQINLHDLINNLIEDPIKFTNTACELIEI